jgi:hypothetical protein
LVFFVEENWRGKRAWENCRGVEAKGVQLIGKICAPPVPDDGYYPAPFLAPLFDFNPKPRTPDQNLARHGRPIEPPICRRAAAENEGRFLAPARWMMTDLEGRSCCYPNQSTGSPRLRVPDSAAAASRSALWRNASPSSGLVPPAGATFPVFVSNRGCPKSGHPYFPLRSPATRLPSAGDLGVSQWRRETESALGCEIDVLFFRGLNSRGAFLMLDSGS